MTVYEGKMMYCKYFSPFLEDNKKGEIRLVTSKGTYFCLSNRIFQLTDSAFGTTPIGIGIDNVGFLTECNLKEGQALHWKDGILHFPGGVLKIRIQHNSATHATVPMPELICTCARELQAKCKPRGVSSLCGPLLITDTVYDPITDPLCQIAYPLLTELMQSLQHCRSDAVITTVKQLIGMGVGLTPSMDDVLLGMMYGLSRIAPDAPATRMLTDAIKTCAAEGTNSISAAFLFAVADGAPFERLDDVLMGLSGMIPLNIDPILEIGSSSGSEMLLGLLIAAKIIYL